MNLITRKELLLKKKFNKKRIILAILIIIWAILVFYLSNQGSDDSSDMSFRFTALFLKDEKLIEIAEPYARKIAHFLEYCYGGLLFGFLFDTYDWKDRKILVNSALLGMWYAALDEIHQIFVPGRAGRFVDVYLDTLGVLTGTVLALIIIKIFKKANKKNRKK